MKVYLDNGATTRVAQEVMEEMHHYFDEHYGNAQSLHSWGQRAKEAMDKSRKTIAEAIGADPEEIIFTSGGTESNNLALKGIAMQQGKGHIVTTKVEHDCVLNASKWLESQGFEVTYLDVDENGIVPIETFKKALREDTILVSIIHGNNEIGSIMPIEDYGSICRQKGILFHSDACQSFTKVQIDVKEHNIDLLTLNSHKIHGPKGVGALYVRKGVKIVPMAHGGGHERNLRSGTENIPGIVGFAKAASILTQEDVERMSELRDYMISELLKIDHTRLNGADGKDRLCNNVSISFNFVEGESLLMHLDMEGIAVSTGSACSSHSLEPSHVLLAIGLKHEIAHGTIRFTLSKYTTKEEIEYTINKVREIVEKLRAISPLRPGVEYKVTDDHHH